MQFSSTVCSIIVIGLIGMLFRMRARTPRKPARTADGTYVIKNHALNWLMSGGLFALALMLFVMSIFAFVEQEYPDAYVYFGGGFFLMGLGALFLLVDKKAGIEYNETHVAYYYLFKSQTVLIRWDEIEDIECAPQTPFMRIYSGNKKIMVDFRHDGITHFLRFAQANVPAQFRTAVGEVCEVMEYRLKKK